MSKNTMKKHKTLDTLLEKALIPEEEQPYKVPGNWVWTKAGELIELERGITFPAAAKKSQKENNLIGCARTANVQEEFLWDDMIYVDKKFLKNNDKKLLRKKDILMSTANSYNLVGKVSFIHELIDKITFGGFIMAIRVKKPIDPKFLFYYFREQFLSGKIQKLASQTTNIANLNGEKIKTLPLPLPPLKEQYKIAEKIEYLITKIDEAKRLIEEAKYSFELRRDSLLDKAFRGELTSRWRENNNCKESAEMLLNRIEEFHERDYIEVVNAAKVNGLKKPKKIDRSVINDPHPNIKVPKTWKWIQLGEIIDDLTDYHANGSYKVLKEHVELLDEPNYACMIRATNFEKNNFSSLMKYITKDAYDFLAKSKLYGGEILISKIGNTGSVYLMPNLNKPCSLAMNLFALRINKLVDNEYIYYYLKSPMGRANISKFIRGVTTTSIDKKSVRSVWIPLPPISEQREVKDQLKKFLVAEENVQNLINNSISNLETTQQTVLTKALSGELGTNNPTEESAIELLKEVLQSK